MDNHVKGVSQEQQQSDQPKGHLALPDITNEDEGKPSITMKQHQQPSPLQQERKKDPESVFQQEQVQGNQNQQDSDEKHVREKCTQPHIEKHLDINQIQESHELKIQHNQELQTQESTELQTQQQHQKIKTQLNQGLQTQIDVQDLQGQKSQKLQSQQWQEMQTNGDQEKQAHQSQMLPAHQHKMEQTQEIPTTDQAQMSLPGQHQKMSTQNQKQSQKHQLSDKDLQQQQQEQQCKKLKKKLVGENQERINFLVQASQTMALTAESPTAVPGQRALAAQVGSLASAVGRRCVLRLAPALKRCLCKGCGTALVYGLNARVRHRSRRQKHLVVTCLTCHTIKRFVNDPNHRLWFEQEEALV